MILSAPSFWLPEYDCDSSWKGHAPFAFWLLEKHRPKTIVELGVHLGYSYFVFCQAVEWLGLRSVAFGIDAWDERSDYKEHGDPIFDAVVEHNKRYEFSTLIRQPFNDAAPHIGDGRVDLLHIDGTHFYDTVKEDFETYLPKLSDRAVVLFHDTRLGGCSGVWQFFEEVNYPKFEFFHSLGLGVVAPNAIEPALMPLFKASRNQADTIRSIYSEIGMSIPSRALLPPEEHAAQAQMYGNAKLMEFWSAPG